MRNPPWLRDELILALDLDIRDGRRVLDGNHRDVIELSETLKALPLHPDRPDAVRFRNPNGVNLKLANFRAIDMPGHGMGRGNRLDREVWEEFAVQPRGLASVAAAIRAGLNRKEASPGTAPADDEESAFPQGAVLYRLHRARERSAKLAAEKKRLVLKKTGRLACQSHLAGIGDCERGEDEAGGPGARVRELPSHGASAAAVAETTATQQTAE